MVARQLEPSLPEDIDRNAPFSEGGAVSAEATVPVGANMLRIALEFDRATTLGASPGRALELLRERPREFHPALVNSLRGLHVIPAAMRTAILEVQELQVMMVVDQDVRAGNGTLLLARGHELTLPALQLLRRWNCGIGVQGPLRVLVPQELFPAAPAAALPQSPAGVAPGNANLLIGSSLFHEAACDTAPALPAISCRGSCCY